MIEQLTDAALDQLIRGADPLASTGLASETDTEAALRRVRAAAPRTSRPERRRWARRGLLAGSGGAVAAAVAAIVVLLGTTTAQPALAVSRNADGTVTLRVSRQSGIALADITRANRKLAAMGVRARIAEVWPARSRVVKCGLPHEVTFMPWRIPRRQVLILAPDRAGRVGLALAAARLHALRVAGRGVPFFRELPGDGRAVQVVPGQLVPPLGISRAARLRIAALMTVCGGQPLGVARVGR
jgi:hypothetical protein